MNDGYDVEKVKANLTFDSEDWNKTIMSITKDKIFITKILKT